MAVQNPFQREFARLDRTRITLGGNFIIRYGLRNPRAGVGLGSNGVHNEQVIDCYERALEKTHQYFRDRQWSIPTTHPRHEGRIPVYVHDVRRIFSSDSPYTFTSGVFSTIGLRSENGEPTLDSMLQRAEVEAAHEVAHAFVHRHRPPTKPMNDTWRWFDEATAYFVEREVFPDHAECLRSSSHWCLCPEDSLDDLTKPGGNGRSASWFVQYLVRHHGNDFLRDVWHTVTPGESPLQTIARFLHQRHPEEEAELFLAQWFSSAYAIESYFENVFHAAVTQRYGSRAVTESFEMLPGRAAITRDHSLPPAACRYYRFFTSRPGMTLKLKLVAQQPVLEATMIEATELRPMSAPLRLKRMHDGSLEGAITSTRDHSAIILSVANIDLLRKWHTLPNSETTFQLHVNVE